MSCPGPQLAQVHAGRASRTAVRTAPRFNSADASWALGQPPDRSALTRSRQTRQLPTRLLAAASFFMSAGAGQDTLGVREWACDLQGGREAEGDGREDGHDLNHRGERLCSATVSRWVRYPQRLQARPAAVRRAPGRSSPAKSAQTRWQPARPCRRPINWPSTAPRPPARARPSENLRETR